MNKKDRLFQQLDRFYSSLFIIALVSAVLFRNVSPKTQWVIAIIFLTVFTIGRYILKREDKQIKKEEEAYQQELMELEAKFRREGEADFYSLTLRYPD